jgi:hypothetical protein
MKTTALIVVAGLVTLGIGAGAVAQQAGKRGGFGADQTRADAEAKVKAYFARVDANGDGKATKDEFEGARDARRDEFRGKAFDQLDTDKNGQISRSEFDAGAERRGERRAGMRKGRRGMAGAGGPGGREGQRFARIDADGDGSVTQAEMLKAMMDRFDASDANKDGTVTREERRAAMRQMRLGMREGSAR